MGPVTLRLRSRVAFSRRRAWLFVLVGLLGQLPAASDAQSPGDNRPAIRMGAATGMRRYRGGSWGVVAVDVSNP
ncbi:MAG: hypothetical protein ACYC6Y_15160 [Thermoguttaceae bacterium]